MKRSSTLVFEKRPEDNLTWPELFGARVGVVRKIGLVSVNSNTEYAQVNRNCLKKRLTLIGSFIKMMQLSSGQPNTKI